MDTTDHLPLTGERTVPDVVDEAYWFARHVVAYEHAVPLVAGARVLDAGCGEGYGLRMLRAAGAAHVIGADLDGPTVAHARRRYAEDDQGIEVVRCELMALPLPDDAVDLTVSFQVAEHVHDVPGYLTSLRRVTRPGGAVLVATPNRLTFTPDSDTPVNPFHHTEFDARELEEALAAAGLAPDVVHGVRHGPRLTAWEHVHGRPFTGPMTELAPEDWPVAYRRLVHDTRPADFVLREADLDSCLDLLAVCPVT